MRRCRVNLPDCRYHLTSRVVRRAFEGGQAANRNGRAAMTRDDYCGNLLWQSGLTLFAPEIAIPAGVVGNGASVAGFLTWLGDAITGGDCKTLIFTEYNGAWKDKAKVEFLHRRVE